MYFLQKFSEFLWGLPLIVTILFAGIFFTIGSKFFQFKYFGHILKKTFGNLFGKNKDDAEKGEGVVSPLEAVSIAIGGAVGTGNIGGVATAVAVGGPGATFWMWVAALFGMLIKMVEVSLAVYYRSKDEKGENYGGPTYYMQKGLGAEKNFRLWWLMAFIFGIGIFSSVIFTMQNYTVSEAVSSTFNINMLAVSAVYLILSYVITVGGIPWLGKVSSILVPFMCLFYILGGLFIILKNISSLPNALGLIFKGAFDGTAAIGGFSGAAVSMAIRNGIARSVFSNEAGWGTSPMIHASSKIDHPIKQGLWGAFEVFVDTIIVCSITALVIIITGQWSSGLDGATLTLSAFEIGTGALGRVIVAISVFLFGLSTTGGWYAYFEVLIRHLFGDRTRAKEMAFKVFRAVYPIPGFLIVVIAVLKEMPGAEVWLLGDIASGVPTFINVIAILLLSGKFFELLKDYKARYIDEKAMKSDFKVFYEDKIKSS